jgi:hypothetical protein
MQRRKINFLAIFFILLIILPFASGKLFFFIKEKEKTCGDGTLYGNCSLIKPYFCNEGKLIENASKCGCPEGKEKNEELCFSEYSSLPKKIELKYFFNGKENSLSLILYGGIKNEINRRNSLNYQIIEENNSLRNFKINRINEDLQKEEILSLVKKIENLAPESKLDQARIAISIVQNIEYNYSNKTSTFFGKQIKDYRNPYEVLYDLQGICGEKSELLVLILKELGYDVAFLVYSESNHEAVGIKCPDKYSISHSGYCFVETTSPSIITDEKIPSSLGYYIEEIPEIIPIPSGNLSLPEKMEEYRNAKEFSSIREEILEKSWIWPFKKMKFERLKNKYGMGE